MKKLIQPFIVHLQLKELEELLTRLSLSRSDWGLV